MRVYEDNGRRLPRALKAPASQGPGVSDQHLFSTLVCGRVIWGHCPPCFWLCTLSALRCTDLMEPLQSAERRYVTPRDKP
ncbi:hypothetical protein SKAU_G00155000 [Synaphobranchus kaupii]|uniref:Uncharacterized protein n=1 Tax=Synaphobranchus kaupii TaxID=118154 RepID=A0A9Q1FHE9_SYNKA|nr:hypothetical protein SKAU_G00155000 [Synaphobranchus kaupii]